MGIYHRGHRGRNAENREELRGRKDNAEAQRCRRFAEEEGSFDCGLRKAQTFAQDDNLISKVWFR